MMSPGDTEASGASARDPMCIRKSRMTCRYRTKVLSDTTPVLFVSQSLSQPADSMKAHCLARGDGHHFGNHLASLRCRQFLWRALAAALSHAKQIFSAVFLSVPSCCGTFAGRQHHKMRNTKRAIFLGGPCGCWPVGINIVITSPDVKHVLDVVFMRLSGP